MKKFLALALVGLMATSANAMIVTLVARSGPNAYTGGAPSLSNGSVGNNVAGGGVLPSAGGAGMTVQTSGTATMGIVVQLLGGTDGIYQNPDTTDGRNQLSTAIFFLASQTLGATGAVDLAGVNHTAVNQFGNEWRTFAYSTGMNHWISTRTGGVGGDLLGGTAPFIENFHQIDFDDIPAGGQGGNEAGLPNATFLATEIIVHGITLGAEARLVFNTGNSEFFTENSKAYGFVNSAPATVHGGSNAAPGGFWYAANGRTKQNAFPIEVVIPEPASLAILGMGALALLRKRVR